MADLDKSKPFGQIFGDEEGRIYEQNGKYFDSQGKEWGVEEKPKRGRPAKAEEPKKEEEPEEPPAKQTEE